MVVAANPRNPWGKMNRTLIAVLTIILSTPILLAAPTAPVEIPKPAFHAYRFLNSLGNELVAD